jgi:hypothetical protein
VCAIGIFVIAIAGTLAIPRVATASEGALVTFSGVLRTAEGQPVPNALVSVNGTDAYSVTYTTSSGAFSLQAPTPRRRRQNGSVFVLKLGKRRLGLAKPVQNRLRGGVRYERQFAVGALVLDDVLTGDCRR